MANAVAKKLVFRSPIVLSSKSLPKLSHFRYAFTSFSRSVPTIRTITTASTSSKKKRVARRSKAAAAAAEAAVKRRTRSDKEFDEDAVLRYGDSGSHIPVMLGEVLQVFAATKLRSFVDCTLGAAGHSSAIVQAHPEMQLYVGMDIDPDAHEKAQARINSIVSDRSSVSSSELKAQTFVKNYKDIKSALLEVDNSLLTSGVDGILMDLGMSSMQVNNAERGFSVLCDGPLDMRMNYQASLKAEDILNSWPDVEVGRILREYGEESNWYSLQNKIVKARQQCGLHSTGELVKLIQHSTSWARGLHLHFYTILLFAIGGRQGWIKTATRVFQALRIAVNDELNVLKDSLYASFDCLAPGGRLAVISFHSLEDRIVKQTFLDIISSSSNECRDEEASDDDEDKGNNETWIKRKIQGLNGKILTKRPITPSQEEEKLNRRSRSAKLRVIQKYQYGSNSKYSADPNPHC